MSANCKHTELKLVHENIANFLGGGDSVVIRCASCDLAISVFPKSVFPNAGVQIFHTAYLSSNLGKGCDRCDYSLGFDKDISDGINHYLTKHGYKLLHVGQEWSRDDDGKTIHHTVAVLGCPVPLTDMPLKPLPKIDIRTTGVDDRH